MEILMATVVFIATSAAQSSDSDFQIDYYGGIQQNGVIRLIYKSRKSDWPRQPNNCYGALINWQQAVLPCSCVGYADDAEMASAWYQASHSKKLKAISASDISVGLMADEHSTKGEEVGVLWIRLHRKCDATFQVDFALLQLQKKHKKSRLVWVNSPHYEELKNQINVVSFASAVSDECHILRWRESIFEPGGPSTWEVQRYTVKFQHWHLCIPLVCPLFMKDGKTSYKPKKYEECFNKNVQGHRYCLTGTNNVPICDLVPGTPVFCNMGTVSGIMGIITNFTTHCSYARLFNGVMAAFDDAMELAQSHLRVKNSGYYSSLHIKGFKTNPKIPATY